MYGAAGFLKMVLKPWFSSTTSTTWLICAAVGGAGGRVEGGGAGVGAVAAGAIPPPPQLASIARDRTIPMNANPRLDIGSDTLGLLAGTRCCRNTAEEDAAELL